jgi:sulfate transport system ATP-binding protein
VARFIGQPTVYEKPYKLKGFEMVDRNMSAVLRPEYITVNKHSEVLKYPVTAEKGIVERVSFRGNFTELKIRINDEVITATRQLSQDPIDEGEHVWVFIHTIYVLDGEKTYTLQNEMFKQDIASAI